MSGKLKREEHIQQLVTKWTQHMKWRPDYESWVNVRLWQENYQSGRILGVTNFLGVLSGKKVLNLGCGMGGFSVALGRESVDVTSLDFNPEYCKITKLRGDRYDLNISPVNGMGEYLPFKAEQFDLVCLFDVLEHVQQPRLVLRESHRALKGGGKLAVTVINKYALRDPHYHLLFINWMPKTVAEWYIRQRKHTKDSPCEDSERLSELHYFTLRGFKKLAGEIGFEVELPALHTIAEPSRIRNPKMARYVRILNRFGMARLVYKFVLLFYFSSFYLILTKR